MGQTRNPHLHAHTEDQRTFRGKTNKQEQNNTPKKPKKHTQQTRPAPTGNFKLKNRTRIGFQLAQFHLQIQRGTDITRNQGVAVGIHLAHDLEAFELPTRGRPLPVRERHHRRRFLTEHAKRKHGSGMTRIGCATKCSQHVGWRHGCRCRCRCTGLGWWRAAGTRRRQLRAVPLGQGK